MGDTTDTDTDLNKSEEPTPSRGLAAMVAKINLSPEQNTDTEPNNENHQQANTETEDTSNKNDETAKVENDPEDAQREAAPVEDKEGEENTQQEAAPEGDKTNEEATQQDAPAEGGDAAGEENKQQDATTEGDKAAATLQATPDGDKADEQATQQDAATVGGKADEENTQENATPEGDKIAAEEIKQQEATSEGDKATDEENKQQDAATTGSKADEENTQQDAATTGGKADEEILQGAAPQENKDGVEETLNSTAPTEEKGDEIKVPEGSISVGDKDASSIKEENATTVNDQEDATSVNPSSVVAPNNEDDTNLSKADAPSTNLVNEVPPDDKTETDLSKKSDIDLNKEEVLRKDSAAAVVKNESDPIASINDGTVENQPVLNAVNNQEPDKSVAAIVNQEITPSPMQQSELILKKENDPYPKNVTSGDPNIEIINDHVPEINANPILEEHITIVPGKEPILRSINNDQVVLKMEEDVETDPFLVQKPNENKSKDPNGMEEKIQTLQQNFKVIAAFSGILLILSLIQVIIGCLYKNNCPKNSYIPIYLIVTGILGICLAAVGVGLGCVWTYGSLPTMQMTDPTNIKTYCDKTVSNIAVVTTIISGIFSLVFIICSYCVIAPKNELEPKRPY
ncbi:unnamed protein product [Adineta steineri]|uniref:Uncharacterized protein n=1 Tax=Adineta steineri TaxID=433720 RepID=A0A815JGV1_9BILA|nr:unnamed protein product [Adineta steineri]CAF1376513.1 unnamed protein product [Adineta steineri]